MKKEGTGKPQNPDIAFVADVRTRELYFEKVPDLEVRFRGNTTRNSVWGSRRENLPDQAQEGVVYRNAEVRLRITSEIVSSAPSSLNISNKEREHKSLEHRREKTKEHTIAGEGEKK